MPRTRQAFSERDLAFIRAYTTPGTGAFGNATEAAVTAGFGRGKRKTASASAARLLARPDVKAMVDVARKAAEAGAAVTREQWLKRLWHEARHAGEAGARVSALRELGKAQGYYPAEKHEHSGLVTIHVVDPYAQAKATEQ